MNEPCIKCKHFCYRNESHPFIGFQRCLHPANIEEYTVVDDVFGDSSYRTTKELPKVKNKDKKCEDFCSGRCNEVKQGQCLADALNKIQRVR